MTLSKFKTCGWINKYYINDKEALIKQNYNISPH